jgi:transposase
LGDVEIVSRVERRRKWTASEKAALLAEVEAEGGKVKLVAHRHGISESLLYNWRSAWKMAASMRVAEGVDFVPVGIIGQATEEQPKLLTAPDQAVPTSGHQGARTGRIEIELISQASPGSSKPTAMPVRGALRAEPSRQGTNRQRGNHRGGVLDALPPEVSRLLDRQEVAGRQRGNLTGSALSTRSRRRRGSRRPTSAWHTGPRSSKRSSNGRDGCQTLGQVGPDRCIPLYDQAA